MNTKSYTQTGIDNIRLDFPILQQKIHGQPLIYFDNAATTQKPKQVLDTLLSYYTSYNSNIHRGVHTLAQEATEAYEKAREKVRSFINARQNHEIIFTKGTTESINLVAASFGKKFIQPGDEVILTEMEHHSNIVPWQLWCAGKGAELKVVPVSENGELESEQFREFITARTKIIALTHVSNTLGTINPVKKIIRIAHEKNIPVLIDGAQAVAHFKIDVRDLDCDFYCFSGHKMYGPTGIGILYGKEKYLDEMPPFQGGGSMIKSVSFRKTEFAALPLKFEGGTPPIAGAIALGSAIDFLNASGYDVIIRHENQLTDYALRQLNNMTDVKIIGNAKRRTSVISFNIHGIHPYDCGAILDKLGIAVRTGHHCTQPLMDKFGIPGTVRISFAVYNTLEEIDMLVAGIDRVKSMLGK